MNQIEIRDSKSQELLEVIYSSYIPCLHECVVTERVNGLIVLINHTFKPSAKRVTIYVKQLDVDGQDTEEHF